MTKTVRVHISNLKPAPNGAQTKLWQTTGGMYPIVGMFALLTKDTLKSNCQQHV